MIDIICDIDGTIANCEHRLHYVTQKPKNFKKFMDLCPQDTSIQPLLSMIVHFDLHRDYRVLFCTGRSEEYREQTEQWLIDYDLRGERVYMRKAKDYRADTVVKEELLMQMRKDGFHPTIAFEDRTRVVDMYRANGLIVAQMDKGDY